MVLDFFYQILTLCCVCYSTEGEVGGVVVCSMFCAFQYETRFQELCSSQTLLGRWMQGAAEPLLTYPETQQTGLV